MSRQIVLPSLRDNVESCDILSVLVREGDVVSMDQDLVEVETDKAIIRIPSSEAGRISKILVVPGQTLYAGSPLCEIEDLHSESTRIDTASGSIDGPDLTQLRSEADASPVSAKDVSLPCSAGLSYKESSQSAYIDRREFLDAFGPVSGEKITRIRQAISRNMILSYTTIPQLTNFDDADVTDIERARHSYQEGKSVSLKLTLLPFLVKALATVLPNHPVMNASISDDGSELLYKHYVNIGVATDTDQGLLVPVIHDPGRKQVLAVARELIELADMARRGTIALENCRGGTFTVSNLGAVGGTYATPIINPPESAILVVGRCRIQPQYVDGQVEPRHMLPLSLTYDHRIMDGSAAARFINDLKRELVAISI